MKHSVPNRSNWPLSPAGTPLRPLISWLVITALLLSSGVLSAQNKAPSVRILHIQESIRIDAKLEEEVWRRARPIGPLIQVEPRQGEKASEETEVRVLYDREALYFGILCKDSTPSRIVASQLTRDAQLEVDDFITLVLDPFFDQRSGFFFEVNPAGARADGQISNNDEHPSYDWDGVWMAAARITPEGWVAELAIPFKTLRFKPGQTTWGLNIERRIKRKIETDRWSGARRDVWSTNLAEAGHLQGIENVRQGLGFEIRPFGLAERKEGSGDVDGGIDVSKNITPNLNASLTVNTDFAETEVDARQVNLTRFPLFFPEKRTFFLEGAGIFETTGHTTSHDLLPYFSRRIGLLQGREVPILLGSKVVGRQSGFNIGFLDVQTRRSDDLDLDGQNLLVARVSKNLFRQSAFGGIFTRGNPTGQGDNTLVGTDAQFATSDFRGGKNLSLDLYIFRTDDEATRKVDYAGGFKIDYPNDLWDISFAWKQIGKNFQPALGFVPRRDIRKSMLGIEFMPRPERYGIRQLFFELDANYITDLNNVAKTWSLSASPVKVEMESGEYFEFSIDRSFEFLDEPFEIAEGIVIPTGSYLWTRFATAASTANKRYWVVDGGYEWGSFYEGDLRTYRLGLKLKPNSHLAFGAAAERNQVELPEGRFHMQILSLQADYNFSPNVSWTNLVQYDNESRILGFQSRFRWILKPGNDLFLVLNRGWYRTFSHYFESSFDRLTAKLQYTFRF
jgi:hypothetical protein